MGTYLSTPVLDKSTMSGDDLDCPVSPLSWACVDMQGWRKSMEDAHVARTDVPVPPIRRKRPPPDPDGGGGNDANDTAGDAVDAQDPPPPRAKVFAVFDGHGGPEVARFCERHIVDVITSQEGWAGPSSGDGGDDGDAAADGRDVGRALVCAFHAMDRLIDDPARRAELAELRALAQWHVTRPYEEDARGDSPRDGEGVGGGGTTGAVVADAVYGADAVDDDEDDDGGDADAEAEADEGEDDEDLESEGSEASSGCSTESLMGSDTDLDSLSSASDEDVDEEVDTADAEADDADEGDGAAITTADAMALFQKLLSMSNDKAREGESPAGPALTGGDVEKGSGEVVLALEKREEESSSVTVTMTKSADDGKVVCVTKEKEESTTATATIEVDGATAEMTSTSSKAVVVSDEQECGGGDEKKRAEELLGNGCADASASSAEPSAPPLELPVAPTAAPSDSTAVVKTVTTTTTTTQSTSSSVTFAASRTYPNGRKVCTLADHPIQAGCTSIVAVLVGRTLTVANAGDSRAVLCRAGGVTHPLSYDHKPLQDTEMDRIVRAGGFVNQFGRVNGNLNLSRSIGDLKYKQTPGLGPDEQMITAQPDVIEVELADDDEFVVIGCDGIWDCLSNEGAVRYVRDRLDDVEPADVVAEMLDEIVSDDPRATQGIGGDNMTCMIVDLLPRSRRYRGGPGCCSGGGGGGGRRQNSKDDVTDQGGVGGERGRSPLPPQDQQKCQQRPGGGGGGGGAAAVGGDDGQSDPNSSTDGGGDGS